MKKYATNTTYLLFAYWFELLEQKVIEAGQPDRFGPYDVLQHVSQEFQSELHKLKNDSNQEAYQERQHRDALIKKYFQSPGDEYLTAFNTQDGETVYAEYQDWVFSASINTWLVNNINTEIIFDTHDWFVYLKAKNTKIKLWSMFYFQDGKVESNEKKLHFVFFVMMSALKILSNRCSFQFAVNYLKELKKKDNSEPFHLEQDTGDIAVKMSTIRQTIVSFWRSSVLHAKDLQTAATKYGVTDYIETLPTPLLEFLNAAFPIAFQEYPSDHW